jgi:hypothetical protein
MPPLLALWRQGAQAGEAMVRFLGWIVWGIYAFLALAWAYGMRTYTKKGQSVPIATAIQALFWCAIAVAFLLVGYSSASTTVLASFSLA